MFILTVFACIGWIVLEVATKEQKTQKRYIEEDWSDPDHVKIVVR